VRGFVIIPLAVALAVAGCGSSKQEAAPRTATNAVVIKPLGGIGHWAKLLLSLDGKTWLGQWSGECEVQETYFIPAAGGAPRPVTGRRGDESIALGWALHNRARILVPRAACGGQFGKPGIYLVGRDGHASLVKRVKARPGGA
jgi:hypothetical protein